MSKYERCWVLNAMIQHYFRMSELFVSFEQSWKLSHRCHQCCPRILKGKPTATTGRGQILRVEPNGAKNKKRISNRTFQNFCLTFLCFHQNWTTTVAADVLMSEFNICVDFRVYTLGIIIDWDLIFINGVYIRWTKTLYFKFI